MWMVILLYHFNCRLLKNTGLYLRHYFWQWITLIVIFLAIQLTGNSCSCLELPAWWLLRKISCFFLHVCVSKCSLVRRMVYKWKWDFDASKYEEICAPQVKEFCYVTDNTYCKDEVRLYLQIHFQFSSFITTYINIFFPALIAADFANGICCAKLLEVWNDSPNS